MTDLFDDPEIKKKVSKISKETLEDMLEKPSDVGNTIENFYPEIFKIFGFDIKDFEDSLKDLENDKKEIIFETLTNLKMILLMQPAKKVNNEISNKISELFELCEKKNKEALKKIFEKPRMELLRKLLTSFKRSWRLIDEKDLEGEPVLDNRIRMIKTFSEGVYKELLIVIQEMIQIAYDRKPVFGFGQVINQIENAPDDMSLLVNKSAYNIRNSESHENVEYEGEKALIYDKKGKLIEEKTIEELNEVFEWITNFVNTTFYSLQDKYLNMMKIGHNKEDRIEYMLNVLYPSILEKVLKEGD